MMKSKEGFIHSIESFGTVDGPGIRFVIFFQGCPMRCQYCHNPDTWNPGGGEKMTVEELLKEYEKNKGFYKTGGITATGGEPLMQMEFLTELFTEAKKRQIHTCLDTSGILYTEKKKEAFQNLFQVTDLVLLDIKNSREEGHLKLTRQPQKPVLEFADALAGAKVPVIIRHVIVPGITDSREELEGVGTLISRYPNLKGLEVLPYHTMGIKKYEELGLSYPLEGVESMPKEEAKNARKIILETIKKERMKRIKE